MSQIVSDKQFYKEDLGGGTTRFGCAFSLTPEVMSFLDAEWEVKKAEKALAAAKAAFEAADQVLEASKRNELVRRRV